MSADLAAVVTALAELRREVRFLTALLTAAEHQRVPPTRPLRLEDCGDVVTQAELGRLLGRGPRYCERLVTLERRSGVRVLPPTTGGPGRYLRRDVEVWLRRGGLPRRANERAGRAGNTDQP